MKTHFRAGAFSHHIEPIEIVRTVNGNHYYIDGGCEVRCRNSHHQNWFESLDDARTFVADRIESDRLIHLRWLDNHTRAADYLIQLGFPHCDEVARNEDCADFHRKQIVIHDTLVHRYAPPYEAHI